MTFNDIKNNISNWNKNRKPASPFLLSILSFLVIIFIGSILLVSPLSHQDGNWGNYADSLLLASAATCVTGLVPYENGLVNELTFFGQLVILICVQIGGLSFITILAFIITLFKKKLQFKDRYSLVQLVGAESMAKLYKFVRKVILITFCIEFAGFLICLPAFMTIYENGSDAIWTSIFHSVSAYNNAGFDIFSTTSFIRETASSDSLLLALPNWAYNYLLIVTMILVLLGGISYVVMIELFTFKNPKQYTVFTKIVLIMTTILILGGTGLLLLTDGIKGDNSMTFMQALFQSVNLRTAGFASYSQNNLSAAGQVFSCLLMFVGGSPLSTAGGIKITTAFLLILSMYSYLRGKRVSAFKRYFSQKTILKGMTLTLLAFFTVIICYILYASIEANNLNYPIDDYSLNYLLYLSFSAFSTSGISNDIIPFLRGSTKIILCIEMFIGRLGPITFFQLIHNNIDNIQDDKAVRYVEADILIG